MSRATMAALLIFAVAGPAAGEAKKVTPGSNWVAVIRDDNLKKEAPKGGVITDAKAFEKLWKAWRKGEKLPKVDFKKELVVVVTTTGPNSVSIHQPTLDDGDLKFTVAATLIFGDGFGYSIATFDRKGVKKVNGKALPKPKAKPGEPGN